jgi:hypothetical protein
MTKIVKKTFKLDLTDYDVREYNRNPLVLRDFSFNDLPVARATVAKDKKSVEIELYAPDKAFVDLVMGDKCVLRQAYMVLEGRKEKKLLGLALIAKGTERKGEE